MSQTRSQPIYGNCKVLGPDGKLMFRCGRKKADWYITRNLADVIKDNESHYTVQLNFEPKGYGHRDEPFYLQEKHNRCVVCGTTENLTKHHCIPYCYRRALPAEYKKFTSHDIVAVCLTHHHAYEIYAYERKKELSVVYKVPINGTGTYYDHEIGLARKAAKALYYFKDKIPDEKVQVLEQTVKEYLEEDDYTKDDLMFLVEMNPSVGTEEHKRYGEGVAAKLTDIKGFCREWRAHFVETMKPQYLPEHWSIDYIPKA